MSRSVKKTWAGHEKHVSTAYQKKETHRVERAREHHFISVQSREYERTEYPYLTIDAKTRKIYCMEPVAPLDIDIPRRHGPGNVAWERDIRHGPRTYKVQPWWKDWDENGKLLPPVVLNPHTREYHNEMGK